jgi:hypothetical protein
MGTNLKINPELLEEAKRVGHFKTKKDAVNQALEEFIQRRKQVSMLDWEGKIDFHEDFEHYAKHIPIELV